jgi:adenylate kinase
MGDIFREILKENTALGMKVKGYVEKGLLVPDDVVIEVLRQHLAKTKSRKGFLLDGYPRTVDQAHALKKIARIDAVIQLVVPEWIVMERLSTRRICKDCGAVYNIRYLKPKVEDVCDKCGGPLYQRTDDTPEVIKERIGVYERQTQPILEYYKAKHVPSVVFKTESIEMPPEVAVEEIMKGLDKLDLGEHD